MVANGSKTCEQQNKNPRNIVSRVSGELTWQRPTLAQAIQALPSALRRFTVVFGMGTCGSIAAMPPGKLNAAIADAALKNNSLTIAYRMGIST